MPIIHRTELLGCPGNWRHHP